ncbi:MAG: alkaline phosphatase [Bacteroidales bacterium]|nr:alkaline phosphatase [Bacteroidales bacterium]
MKRILSISLTFLVTLAAYAQQLPIIYHSHNDYNRTVPFWEAYSQHCASIEADVFLQDGEILVAHNRKDVTAERSLRKMYIEPIVKTFRENGGRMWKGSDDRLQLVVDLKTGESLPGVIALAEEYPDVFTTENGVKIVITGDEPAPEDFGKWPAWLWFDGDFKDGKLNYTPEQLKRIAMISTDFRKFARNWNGKGRMINSELEAVTKAIETAHEAGKPIRFWDAPEGTTAYFTLHKLGVDFFNTDYPAQCALFFSNWTNKNFRIGRHAVQAGVTGTKRLDKATRDFQGFQNEKMQLSKGIEVYSPTYRNDASNKKIKNVIFLIGDGMGLGQILSGAYASGRDLSMLRMKMMGLQFYNPNDDFIGDSASGGSALATGEISWTRHIAANEDGSVEYPNLCDYFHAQGKATGVVTLGDLADATPSVFYAHTAERDSIDKVTRYLATNKSLDLLAGSGTDYFEDPREDGFDLLTAVKANGFNYTHDALSTNSIPGRVICADQRMREYAREETLGFLADITRESIAKMQSMSRKGFFLMVEGAKIDYAGHSDCLPASIIETLSFDLAVAEALKFADSNGETLVVVTADHETGGLTILDGDLATGHVLAVYNSDDHTPSALPVFAYGPGSQHFTGTYMNIEIPRTIKRLVKK